MKVKRRDIARTDPAGYFAAEVPDLLAAEADLGPWIDANVIQTLATLATAVTSEAQSTRDRRASLERLAKTLGEEVPRPLGIPDVDPDGRLWSALQNGDAPAAARAFGELTAALIAKGG